MLQKGTANTVIAKRRCLYCILISVMFLIAANIGITALLLYYINLSKVKQYFWLRVNDWAWVKDKGTSDIDS